MLDIDVVLFYGRGGGETHEQHQPAPDAGDHRTGPSSTGGGYFPVVPSRRSVLLRLGQGSGEIRDAACAFLRGRHGDRCSPLTWLLPRRVLLGGRRVRSEERRVGQECVVG